MLKKLQHNPIIVLLLFVVLMLGFTIHYLPVSIMEARNFITAREMLTDGNWLLTTMNGEARYEKPPLPTWFTAIFAQIFGITKLTALRFPAIIFIALTGIFTFLLSKQLTENTKHSFINALIVVTSFYVIGITMEAPWDIFTHGFMLMGIYFLFQFFQAPNANYKYVIIAGVMLGGSILCKGPVSFYALLLPFLIAYGIVYKYKAITKKIPALLLFLVTGLLIGGWWYLYVRLNDPGTFAKIAERETGNWGSYNVRPFYYYWSFFTQSGIWTIPAFIGLLYPYLKTRVSNLKAYRFSFYWTILAVVLLSIVPEKKSRYLMPVLIPLAINTGFYIEYLFRSFKDLKDKRETIPVYFNFGLIALIGVAFPIAAYFFLGSNITNYWFPYILTSLTVLGLGIGIIIQLKKKDFPKVFYFTVLFFASLFLTGLTLANALKGSNYNPVSNLKAEADEEQLQVYGLGYVSPEVIWQFGDKIPSLKTEEGTFQLPETDAFGLLTQKLSKEDKVLLSNQYEMEFQTTFDLNLAEKNSKKHNGRLVNEYYILRKK
ncbi:ArnT family glycosyltransferase [Mangrovimonas xylaniphaga]|uniref:ArnT family glycosyltransferase n=1 Tax=Mangrovimonas xylaniphaga TaxID=1645915 RepID=UPI0006B49E45|nr:phospholipid carrier-dependent glycosyltransferase [Mangrovimonas xylaniphaga]